MADLISHHSTSWFLRPPHLQPTEKCSKSNVLNGKSTTYDQTTPKNYSIAPVEEMLIRESCPITLSHLLPDLYLTRNINIGKGHDEYIESLTNRCKQVILRSCASETFLCSNENEDDNLLFFVRDERQPLNNEEHRKTVKFRRNTLFSNKVNYPEDDMEFIQPSTFLNNTQQKTNSSFPAGDCSPTFVQKVSKGEKNRQLHYSKRTRSSTDLNNKKINNCRSKSTPPMLYDHSYGVMTCHSTTTAQVKTLSSLSLNNDLRPYSENGINKLPKRFSTNFNMKRRTPAIALNLNTESKSSVLSEKESSSDNISFKREDASATKANFQPISPHFMELQRLKIESLKMEEKLLLKRRRLLELQRLRPPSSKWYELKDPGFHEEAKRNNIYIKNEKNLPQIQARRRQLREILKISNM